MDPLLIFGLFFLLGMGLTAVGIISPSISAFLDRPLCWLLGHPAGNRYLYPTTYMGQPAEAWRCERCHNVVILVGTARRLNR